MQWVNFFFTIFITFWWHKCWQTTEMYLICNHKVYITPKKEVVYCIYSLCYTRIGLEPNNNDMHVLVIKKKIIILIDKSSLFNITLFHNTCCYKSNITQLLTVICCICANVVFNAINFISTRWQMDTVWNSSLKPSIIFYRNEPLHQIQKFSI